MTMTIVLWFLSSLAVGVAAHLCGRNSIGWCWLAIVFSPPVAVFLLISLKWRQKRVERAEFSALLKLLPLTGCGGGARENITSTAAPPGALVFPEFDHEFKNGMLYRINSDQTVEALTPDGILKFRGVKEFEAMALNSVVGRCFN